VLADPLVKVTALGLDGFRQLGSHVLELIERRPRLQELLSLQGMPIDLFVLLDLLLQRGESLPLRRNRLVESLVETEYLPLRRRSASELRKVLSLAGVVGVMNEAVGDLLRDEIAFALDLDFHFFRLLIGRAFDCLLVGIVPCSAAGASARACC
jgi:hypothetical protein